MVIGTHMSGPNSAPQCPLNLADPHRFAVVRSEREVDPIVRLVHEDVAQGNVRLCARHLLCSGIASMP